MTKSDLAFDPVTLRVGTTMGNDIRHRSQHFGSDRAAIEIKDTRDSAHDSFSVKWARFQVKWARYQSNQSRGALARRCATPALWLARHSISRCKPSRNSTVALKPISRAARSGLPMRLRTNVA